MHKTINIFVILKLWALQIYAIYSYKKKLCDGDQYIYFFIDGLETSIFRIFLSLSLFYMIVWV